MKKILAALILVALLTACGTDGSAPSASPRPTTSQGTVINETIKTSDYPMKDTPYSSCFSQIGYKGGNLVVTFRDSGASYIYYAVPRDVWFDLNNADSMGSYYNSYIKGEYTCHKLEG